LEGRCLLLQRRQPPQLLLWHLDHRWHQVIGWLGVHLLVAVGSLLLVMGGLHHCQEDCVAQQMGQA
jgi:hypothetical protein